MQLYIIIIIEDLYIIEDPCSVRVMLAHSTPPREYEESADDQLEKPTNENQGISSLICNHYYWIPCNLFLKSSSIHIIFYYMLCFTNFLCSLLIHVDPWKKRFGQRYRGTLTHDNFDTRWILRLSPLPLQINLET